MPIGRNGSIHLISLYVFVIFFFSFTIYVGLNEFFFFSVSEVIAFPAGGIAALIVLSIVVIMVIVKIICVLTGYENRLPVIRIDPEDPKQTLLALDLGGCQEGGSQETTLSPGRRLSFNVIFSCCICPAIY